MPAKENKVHTGFRLSKGNIDYIVSLSESLGLTRTNVMDMIITLIRKDKRLIGKLIQKELDRQ